MMNGKEQQRAMILTAAVEGRLTTREAADLMSLGGLASKMMDRLDDELSLPAALASLPEE